MKIQTLLAATLLLTASAFAGPGHAHDTKKVAGPNGGRVLTSVEPHAEFFVTTDRKVQITFLDDSNKAIAAGDQVVTVTTGDRSAPTKLTFVKSGEVLVSEQVLPEGSAWPAVVQIKSAADAKPLIEKFNLNLAICPGCKLGEYACTCDHAH
jgi:hypothetical protein